jgi:hypothetical protein
MAADLWVFQDIAPLLQGLEAAQLFAAFALRE